MGFRFRKSIKLLPGIRLNFGAKSGPSLSIGGKGLTTNFSKRGTRTTVSLPGTGLSFTSSSKATAAAPRRRAPKSPPIQAPTAQELAVLRKNAIDAQRRLEALQASARPRLTTDRGEAVPISAALTALGSPKVDHASVPSSTTEALFWSPESDARKRRLERARSGLPPEVETSEADALVGAPGCQLGHQLHPASYYFDAVPEVGHGAATPVRRRRVNVLEMAWLGFFGLIGLSILATGQPLLFALVAWLAVLPVGALRARVAKRWSRYLLLGVGLFIAFGTWETYRKGQGEKALVTESAARIASAQAARSAREKQIQDFAAQKADVLTEMSTALAAGDADKALAVAAAWPAVKDPDFVHAVTEARDAHVREVLAQTRTDSDAQTKLLRQLRDDQALTLQEKSRLERMERISSAPPPTERH